jgi:hypothetical protein
MLKVYTYQPMIHKLEEEEEEEGDFGSYKLNVETWITEAV